MPNSRYRFRVRPLVRILRQRQPRLPVVAVQDQCCRACVERRRNIALLSIDQQNHHLAIARLRPVMRAGTLHRVQCVPRGVQIERLQGAQTRPRQMALGPLQGLVAATIQGEKRGERIHHTTRDTPILWNLPSRSESRVAHSWIGKIAYRVKTDSPPFRGESVPLRLTRSLLFSISNCCSPRKHC